MGWRFFFAIIMTALLSSVSLAVAYSGGTGIPTDPYQIATAADLNSIGLHSEDWGNCFKLMADVDMSAYTGTQYNIIGNSTTQFTGTFDGNGYVIRNLTYTTTDSAYIVGVFGIVYGTIKNLGVENVNISIKGSSVGGLVGRNGGVLTNCYATGLVYGIAVVGGLVGSNNDTGTLTACHATGSVSGRGYGDSNVGGLVGSNSGLITECYADSEVKGNLSSGSGIVLSSGYLGGLVGNNSNTLIACHATGSVNGTGFCIGGLVGYNSHASITSCYATGSVSGKHYIGGLVGNNDYSGALTDCYATGSVNGTVGYVGGLIGRNSGTLIGCHATGAVNGIGYYFGGLVGYNYHASIISCSATGSVSGDNYNVGGLVGGNRSGSLTGCYATGAVNVDSQAGGLVGINNGFDGAAIIKQCYSTGSVSGASVVGGLVGGNNYSSSITDCYATGSVSGTDMTGGLVGVIDSGNCTGSFWDTETSGMTTSAGGTGKKTALMKTQSTFTSTGWDFADIWYMNDYPHLQWEASRSQDGLIPLGFVTIQKTRTGRTTFEYELAVIVRNSNSFDMTNVQMQLKDWDAAVLSVSDDSITIDAIPAGATVTSTDTFKIIVDRSTLINSSKLAWILTYYVPAYGIQQATLSMSMSGIDLVPGDITGDSKVNLEDFVIMAQQWDDMPGDPSADIALPPDGHVGIEDLIYLAENWLN